MAEPTPPVSASVDDYFLAEVSLACVAGVGGLLRKRLVARFGSPRAVLTASPEELARVDQVGPKLSRLIPTFADDAAAGELITLCRRRGVDILIEGTVHTSSLLRTQWPERADALREAMERATARFQVRGSLKLPVSAVLASATK